VHRSAEPHNHSADFGPSFVHAPPAVSTPNIDAGPGRSIDHLCAGMSDATLQPPSTRRTAEVPPAKGPLRGQQHRKKTGTWSDQALKAAIATVESGGRVKTVTQYFDIPSSSLADHVHGRTLGQKKGLPQS
jgi:hypothetical protein